MTLRWLIVLGGLLAMNDHAPGTSIPRDALLLQQGEDLLNKAPDIQAGRLVPTSDGHGVTLVEGVDHAELICRPWDAPFDFNEAVASCNVACPTGSWARLYARLGRETDDWSPWFAIGQWGDAPAWDRPQNDPQGPVRINIDILQADPPVRRVQFKTVLARQHSDLAAPQLRLLAMLVSDTRGKAPPAPAPDAVDIAVPFRSQRWVEGSLSREICSPVSVAMVLEHHGLHRDSLEVARLAFDPHHRIHGNWTYNVRAASEYGAGGFVTRYRNWAQVYHTLSRGLPIIASIRFARGQLQSPPYPFTNGHLLVLRGLTSNGDVITNDPNLTDNGEGYVWRRNDFELAWFGRGGIAYVLFPPGTQPERLPEH